ncbi:hypothetical protein RUM44_008701 [Polyplax serrata]|uniref:GTPase Era, mitochondrial n=1 Tax=Polyplax serrata TaxID=468196 RepID=A0ABR1BD19_POLSC
MSVTDASVLPQENTVRKLLKVAIIGGPNVGKSTLINKIMQMNICDVSPKIHTTRIPIKLAFNSGNTQIIFVDTPGLVTKKESTRYKLNQSFLNWSKSTLKEIDIIGVIEEAHQVKQGNIVHPNFVRTLESIRVMKPVFLVVNKVDLLSTSKERNKVTLSEHEISHKTINFSRIFFVSALKGIGHMDIVNYLLGQAKEGEWILDDGVVSDTPIDVVITNLLRAKLLNGLPYEVPYVCKYEVEYLQENNFGELVCVANIQCRNTTQMKFILRGRKDFFKRLSQELEADLYYILKKVVKIRSVQIILRTSLPSTTMLSFFGSSKKLSREFPKRYSVNSLLKSCKTEAAKTTEAAKETKSPVN